MTLAKMVTLRKLPVSMETGNEKTQAHGVDGCELRLSKVKVVDETGLGEFFQMDLSRVESCDLLTAV